MSVELSPAELGFRRPFDHEVTEVLKVKNLGSAPVAFKVKTTAPKQYCVRPNSGTVPPNGAVEVQVLLQAMKEDPPLEAKCRDKFLVQSVSVEPDQDANASTFWSTVEKTSKASIQERKIKVSFLPANSATTNGVVAGEDQPPAYSSPSSNFGSPAAASSEGKSKSVTSSEGAKSGISNAAEASGVAGAAAAVTSIIPTSTEELKAQLAAAQAKISQLTAQAQDPQVRQRKLQEANEKVQTVVQQSSETGVPLHIVAGLCLLSFIIAYLFF